MCQKSWPRQALTYVLITQALFYVNQSDEWHPTAKNTFFEKGSHTKCTISVSFRAKAILLYKLIIWFTKYDEITLKCSAMTIYLSKCSNTLTDSFGS